MNMVLMIKTCAIILPLISIEVSAQNSRQSIDQTLEPKKASALSTSSIAKPAKTELNGFLRAENISYPTRIPENPKLNQTGVLSTQIRLDAYNSDETLHNAFDVSAGRYIDWNSSHYSLNELFISKSIGSTESTLTQFSVGRKIEFWSLLDQDWQLGLWQPKFLLDSLKPQDQGLAGFFFQFNHGNSEFLAFASPLFIPSMGPDIREENGNLSSDSRWYRSPSKTFFLFDKPTELVYSLDVPNVQNLVSKPGAGLRYSWGRQSEGAWASVNAGYKPINSLLLKYKYKLFLPEDALQTGRVTVSPEVGYHTLVGSDLGYNFGQSMVGVSYLEDRPAKQTPGEGWVQQSPEGLKIAGARAQTWLHAPFLADPIGLGAQYMKSTGGGFEDRDSIGQSYGAIFESRLNYMDAAQVNFDLQTRWFQKKWLTRFKYLREFQQKGTLWNAEVSFFPVKNVSLLAGADLLGPDDPNASVDDTRFLNQFRANDRYYGGLSYVF